jgi:hypothetical protein
VRCVTARFDGHLSNETISGLYKAVVGGNTMTLEHGVRIVAGSMVLLSVALAHWVSPYWLFLTAFVGLNLIQSAWTNWCPAENVLKALGLKSARS